MDKTTVIAISLLLLLSMPIFPAPKTQEGDSVSHKLTWVSSDNVTRDFWTTKRPMPTARSRFGIAVVNGKIYVIGGYNGSILNVNEMYDPATDTWTRKRPMPTPRYDFGIAVYQNKIYCIGGFVSLEEEPTHANEVYDPITDTWETKNPMPTPRAQLTANTVNGKIYLIGGRTSNPYSALSINEVYDPITDSWTTKAQIPNAVMDHASVVVDNKIYIMSGHNFTRLIHLTQIYDPLTDSWSYGAPIPTAIIGAAAGATTGAAAPKKIYVIGGGDILPYSWNQVYDIEKNIWITGTSMPTPRRDLGVAVVDDVLYAIGGDSGWTFKFYGTNEQYTPIGYFSIKTQQPEPFPPLWIAAAIAVTAIGGAVLIVYFAKIKKTTMKAKQP